DDLVDRLEGRREVEELWGRRETIPPAWSVRKTPHVPTEVRVDNDASPSATVVEVFTRDRPRLLYTIARTLYEQGLTILLSKINTEGDRAADVFYVEEALGGKVQDGVRLEAIQRSLEASLEELQAEPEARA